MLSLEHIRERFKSTLSSRRCRRDLRKDLAKYVGLEGGEAFLAGETTEVPGVFYEIPIPPLAERELAPLDLLPNLAPSDLLPSQAEAAIRRVGVRVLKRIERDIRNGKAPPPKNYAILRRVWDNPTQRRSMISIALHELLSPTRVRASLIVQPIRMSAADQDAVASALADALEESLKPWLLGKAALDYAAFYNLLTHALHSDRWRFGIAAKKPSRTKSTRKS